MLMMITFISSVLMTLKIVNNTTTSITSIIATVDDDVNDD